MLRNKLISLSGVLVFAICLSTQYPTASAVPQPDTQKPLVVFVVRHAEKVASGSNPDLSEAGQQRAKVLAMTLRNAMLDHVHSTDYNRTQLTAAPTAESLMLQVQKYHPGKLADFADSLRKSGGRHLVVGHSNTTPALVKLLGGDPVSPIDDATEYDRLYVVTIGKAGDCTSILMRYGKM